MTAAVVVTLLVAALHPETAQACAVCFDPEEESNGAFLRMTIFLSLLPLTAIGSVVFWLWRSNKNLQTELQLEAAVRAK